MLVGFLFILPFAEIAKDGVVYLFNYKGIWLDGDLKQNGIALSGLIFIILAFHGFAILSYKKRIRQIRVIVFTILIMLGLFGMFFFFASFSFSDAQISYKISLVFPLLAIILDYLAIRAIGKDEALIRSIDRIR
jgi:protein-S-isoprenylcysteine O-methyltransferase Ste14